MKIRTQLSWVCYFLGDKWERWTENNLQQWFGWPYHVYNRLMIWSSDLQGKDPAGPWYTWEPKQEE